MPMQVVLEPPLVPLEAWPVVLLPEATLEPLPLEVPLPPPDDDVVPASAASVLLQQASEREATAPITIHLMAEPPSLRSKRPRPGEVLSPAPLVKPVRQSSGATSG
jgi:hypothetical protein